MTPRYCLLAGLLFLLALPAFAAVGASHAIIIEYYSRSLDHYSIYPRVLSWTPMR